MTSAKEELTSLVQRQPDNISLEEIVRELLFYVMVRRGLADADAARSITSHDMALRIRALRK
ncbi:MAG TPA: hypothetical protein VJQ58_05245 [Burkholderiales bacterium]|nr:hypothetical protein [Burkholderiales bacterium]